MFNKIKRFVDWLNDEEPEQTSTKKTGQTSPNQLDDAILKALSTLKRSGLALPYEVWDEFVVDVVRQFNEKYPTKIKAMMNTAIYAVRIRRNYLLPQECAPEDRVHREIIWVYGVFVLVVLHHADLSMMQLRQLFGDNPQLAITHDKDLCIAIDTALKSLESDNVMANILRQAIAANEAFQRGGTKDEINAAAEAAKWPVSEISEKPVEFRSEEVKTTTEAAEAFLEWSMLPVSDHIHHLSDGSTFYALPAFAEFAKATESDKATLIAEFETLTGLCQTRETVPDGSRHKGYKKGA